MELKKTTMGKGSKANHLTYLGDATIGAGVNVGCGTITCNYDGEKKHPTRIGDGVFVGSDSHPGRAHLDRARAPTSPPAPRSPRACRPGRWRSGVHAR